MVGRNVERRTDLPVEIHEPARDCALCLEIAPLMRQWWRPVNLVNLGHIKDSMSLGKHLVRHGVIDSIDVWSSYVARTYEPDMAAQNCFDCADIEHLAMFGVPGEEIWLRMGKWKTEESMRGHLNQHGRDDLLLLLSDKARQLAEAKAEQQKLDEFRRLSGGSQASASTILAEVE